MPGGLHMLTATEMVARYRDKKLSPVEVTEARWTKGEPAGPVDGMPMTIKDVTLAKGWPTLRGSKAVDPEGLWDDNEPATARLRESRAVL